MYILSTVFYPTYDDTRLNLLVLLIWFRRFYMHYTPLILEKCNG